MKITRRGASRIEVSEKDGIEATRRLGKSDWSMEAVFGWIFSRVLGCHHNQTTGRTLKKNSARASEGRVRQKNSGSFVKNCQARKQTSWITGSWRKACGTPGPPREVLPIEGKGASDPGRDQETSQEGDPSSRRRSYLTGWSCASRHRP